MAGTKTLVLGGTSPAGIVLLRELLFRKHATVAYVRNPEKIPGDLVENELLEVCCCLGECWDEFNFLALEINDVNPCYSSSKFH